MTKKIKLINAKIREDILGELRKMKKTGESYSDVIERLVNKNGES